MTAREFETETTSERRKLRSIFKRESIIGTRNNISFFLTSFLLRLSQRFFSLLNNLVAFKPPGADRFTHRKRAVTQTNLLPRLNQNVIIK